MAAVASGGADDVTIWSSSSSAEGSWDELRDEQAKLGGAGSNSWASWDPGQGGNWTMISFSVSDSSADGGSVGAGGR